MKHAPKMLEPTRTIAPTRPVVTVEEMKAHGYFQSNDDDALIVGFLRMAEQKLDGFFGETGEAFITQTWRFDFDRFPPGRRFDLPLGPVQSATVAYFDGDNVSQTFAASNFDVLTDATGPFIWLNTDVDTWPSIYEREDAVQVTAVVGYGDNPSDVPQEYRVALMMLALFAYENRGDENAEMPTFADALLRNRRRLSF